MWRDAFRDHFPGLRQMLDVLEDEGSAIAALRDRLTEEVVGSGMDEAPWLPIEFIPGVVSVTERRSMSWFLAGDLVFDWHESAGSVYWASPESASESCRPQGIGGDCRRRADVRGPRAKGSVLAGGGQYQDQLGSSPRRQGRAYTTTGGNSA